MSGYTYHVPVLLDETIKALDIKPECVYVDCTVGGGGHSFEIASRLTTGRLIAIDQDQNAIEAAGKRLAPYSERVTIVRDNFCNVSSVLESLGIEKIHGALIDLGISSHHVDDAERGFSYMKDAPLDMRMDTRSSLTAWHVINQYSKDDLFRILREYGEETRFTSRIVFEILKQREVAPINTTGQLSQLLHGIYPKHIKTGHPAKKTFQAVRIEVNRELDVIDPALRGLVSAMKAGGRLAVITFHSLEDRLVKIAFADMAKNCICPSDFPACVCDKRASVKLVGKSIVPTEEEMQNNSRSISARLRVVEKL